MAARKKNDDFLLLKSDILKWCSSFSLENLLQASELEGDLRIVARKEETSMDLKARRDMNIYLVEAPARKKKEYLARLYVSEMPGASVMIGAGNVGTGGAGRKGGAGETGWRYWKQPAKSGEKPGGETESRMEQRWAYTGDLPDTVELLDEAAFTRLACDWVTAYFAMKSVYYYA